MDGEGKQNLTVNNSQYEFLVRFMTNHTDLTKGVLKTSQARKTSNSLWQKLNISLDEKRPPIKQPHEWRKTWSDIKYKIKAKLRNNIRNIKSTGGGPYIEKKISALEETIIECAGLEASVDGIKSAKTFGVNEDEINIAQNSSNTCEDLVEEVQEQTAEDFENSKNLMNCNGNKSKKNKTEMTTERYVKVTEEISGTLSKILENLTENQKILKRSYHLQEKIYGLKKRKYHTTNENSKEKLKLKKLSLEIKQEKNRLKKMELDGVTY